MQPNVFETANAGFAQALYEDFLRDPASVSPEWRRLFESGQVGERPAANGTGAAVTPTVTNGTPPASTPAGATLIKGPALRLAQNMNESLTVPTATTFRELSVGTLDARRRDLNAALAAAGKTAKLSFTHLIAYALVQGIKKFPVMGHHLLEKNSETFRVAPDGVYLGLAVDVERKDGSRGLMVPVLKHAEAMDFAAFLAEYDRIVEAARTNKMMPDGFMGATVSLTNPGGLGTSASVPRLMKGQGTIIATGAIGLPAAFAQDPKRAAELGVGKVMQMTSTYDHRIIQGAESGAFLRTIDQLLQGQESFYEEIAASLGVVIGAGSQGRSVAAGSVSAPASRSTIASMAPSAPVSADMLVNVAAAMGLVKAHRTHGHLAAQLDPLGGTPAGDPALVPTTIGLTPEIMAAIPASVLRTAVPGATLAEVLPHLRETYCGTIAYEVEHISSHEERVWLRDAIESGKYRTSLAADGQRALLQRLTEVETFEKFLHKAYLGQKRFSIEGVDMLVPMLDLSSDLAAEQGAREVVIGMAHRGRLNVLVHNVGRPYESILAKFEGSKHHPEDPDAGTGDVKYHLGADGTHRTPGGKTIDVSLAPNPSHLEFVGPVVDGRARAKQTSRKGATAQHDSTAAVPIVIHGDAAFAGQGVVAETLNLGALPGYNTGGTLHIITNNQVGFTTDTRDSRSTRYASDLAKGFDIPIIHVNADDPEAALSAVRLAMAYRARFAHDVLIDLVGYRRHGHNEADEPAYTQPLMYERIKALPTVRTRYADRLVAAGVVTQADADAQAETQYQKLVGLQQAMKAAVAQPAPAAPAGVQGGVTNVETALSAELLGALNEELLAWPAGFTVHPKLVKQLERRRQVMGPEGGIDYGHAEALAFGSLLLEGVPIRLTGQDSERGTFSHRHLVLNDAKTGEKTCPAQHLKGALAPLEVFNSPLSELATMGFEYGYSVAAPESLVIWEAQFGDFVNGAQIILDQFVAAGLSKWGQRTRLTLLLPHGYEGQGPEHSSARLERFLQLAAEGNIRVANCSTPAQYFHLLRRQARDPRIRPLVVMTPKSLLRLPVAASKLSDLTTGTFKPVLDDPTADASQVTRIVLCSGKVYYDLAAEAEKLGVRHPAVVRVEQLYPFPADELKALLSRYPRVSEVVWAQEEPRNMGAWSFVYERLAQVLTRGMQLRYAGRPERASPAEGDPAAHSAGQKKLVSEALGQ